MQLPPFLSGIALGFAIAAPVGPIGLLCIRRTLAEGRLVGLLTGLGAAAADALYGAIAAFGLTSLSQVLIRHQTPVRLLGGVFLCYLGLRTMIAQPRSSGPGPASRSSTSALASAFLLTLTNPLTILSFAAVFAGLGIGEGTGDYLAASLLVAGVFIGSALWWFLLSGVVSLFRSRFNDTAMRWVNRLSGSIILLFGVSAILGAT
jgi:threonine/homoserine/homoserine lactone efflux protein